MSSHSSGSDATLAAVAVARTRRLAAAVRERLPWLPSESGPVVRPARRVAFWSAIAVPFLLVGLLARGLSDEADTVAFLSLLVVELVALVLGHSYRRE